MKKVYLIIIIVLISTVSNGQHWQQFGNGILGGSNFYVDSLQNRLCLIGKIINLNNDTIISPAYWDGVNWIPIGNFDFTSTGAPFKLFKYNNTFYLGGVFNKSMGAPGDYALQLNNNSWDSLDFSPDAGVHSFYEFQNRLYIGGRFSLFGPLWTIGVVIHNPPFWSTIPPFTHLPWIQTMTKYNNRLVFAGIFSSDLAIGYKGNIAEWDGVNVFPMQNGLEIDALQSLIVDLEVFNNKLYAGGIFSAINVINGNQIVCWDGQTWDDVGGGMNNDILALQVYNGELYAAGSFTTAGNISAEYIAKWDGFKWCSLGSSFNGPITDMCVYNNELIIIGTFTAIDGQPINHIAKWVGGNYTDSCQVVGIEETQLSDQFLVFPSPAKNTLQIKSMVKNFSSISISDLSGKIIYQESLLSKNKQLDVSGFSNGFYFLLLETPEGRVVKKFVKE